MVCTAIISTIPEKLGSFIMAVPHRPQRWGRLCTAAGQVRCTLRKFRGGKEKIVVDQAVGIESAQVGSYKAWLAIREKMKPVMDAFLSVIVLPPLSMLLGGLRSKIMENAPPSPFRSSAHDTPRLWFCPCYRHSDRGSVRFAYEPTWLKHATLFPLTPSWMSSQVNSSLGIPISGCSWIHVPTVGDKS
jgi:hypothetical protein